MKVINHLRIQSCWTIYKFPNATNYTKQTISLPCYPSLNLKEISHIRKVLDKLKNEF